MEETMANGVLFTFFLLKSLTVTTSAPFHPFLTRSLFFLVTPSEWEQKVAEKEYKIYNFGNQSKNFSISVLRICSLRVKKQIINWDCHMSLSVSAPPSCSLNDVQRRRLWESTDITARPIKGGHCIECGKRRRRNQRRDIWRTDINSVNLTNSLKVQPSETISYGLLSLSPFTTVRESSCQFLVHFLLCARLKLIAFLSLFFSPSHTSVLSLRRIDLEIREVEELQKKDDRAGVSSLPLSPFLLLHPSSLLLLRSSDDLNFRSKSEY